MGKDQIRHATDNHWETDVRPVPRILGCLVLALCAVLLAACSTAGEDPVRSSMPRNTDHGAASDPALIDATLHFSELSLPAGATVLGASHMGALDPLYEIAISGPPASADMMLRDAQVLPRLTTGKTQFMPPMDGFSVEPGPAVFYAEDTLPAGDSRPSTVFRKFYVNRSDPTRTFVYVWAFST